MTSRSHRGTPAALVGAAVGFGLAFLISPHLPFRAAPGQLPGRAAELGFDPRKGLLRLGLVVLLPLLGGVVARWLVPPRFPAGLGGGESGAGERRMPLRRSPPIAIPAVLAHALGAWAFLSGPALWREIAPWTLYALLVAASVALAAVLGRGRIDGDDEERILQVPALEHRRHGPVDGGAGPARFDSFPPPRSACWRSRGTRRSFPSSSPVRSLSRCGARRSTARSRRRPGPGAPFSFRGTRRS